MSGRASPVSGKGPQKEKHVYKEIFFAGFPPSASEANAELVQPFDRQFVHDFFHHYGQIEHFVYNDVHGVGSVTFVSGDDAERFYLAVHLSVLDCPVQVPATEKPRQAHEAADTSAATHMSVMLYLEYAQACPFSNPQVLLKDELLSGEMSRYALQSSAPPEALTRTTAEMVVAEWRRLAKAADTTTVADEATAASRVEVVEDDDNGATTEAAKNAGEAELDVAPEEGEMVLFGPTFPGLPAHPVEIQMQVWQLLRPPHFSTKKAPAEPMRVIVLDLWYEFYKNYVLHKTQPEARRITDPQLRYAEQPSLVQRIKAMHAQADSNPTFARQLRRLAEDDIFHGSLTYVWMLQKYKYDPVWASFVRDVYTTKVSARVEAHLAEWNAKLVARPAHRKGGKVAAEPLSPQARMALALAAQRRDLLKMRADTEVAESASAATWAAMGVFTATENLVENVEYLRLVRLGRVDKITGQVMSLEEKLKRKAKSGDETVDEDAYPLTGTNRQKEEFLYAEIVRMLDGYVQTGAATELLYMCEPPAAFRGSKDHVGYDELHQDRYTRRQYWLAVLNALWVPAILIGVFIWVVQRYVDPADLVPKRPAAKVHAGPRPPPRPNTVEGLHESLRQAEAMAKERGGQFSFKVGAMGDR